MRLDKTKIYEDTNDDLITEEELKNIQLDLDQNFPYPTKKSGII